MDIKNLNRNLMKLVCNRYKLAYDSDLTEISLFRVDSKTIAFVLEFTDCMGNLIRQIFTLEDIHYVCLSIEYFLGSESYSYLTWNGMREELSKVKHAPKL